MTFCPGGIRQKFHYARYVMWVLWTWLIWRPKWVYVSDVLACPVGLLLARFGRARVLYHEHDSPAAEGARSRFFKMTLGARAKLAKSAEMVVFPNQNRLDHFERNIASGMKPGFCVWNCPAKREVIDEERDAAGPEMVLFYHGSIVPARVPLTLIDALAQLSESIVFRLAGYETVGHRGYLAELADRAKSLGVDGRYQYLGALSRSALLPETRRGSVGIVLFPPESGDLNELNMVGASNKPFEYMACGLPLIVPKIQEWLNAFVEPGFGIACDPADPADIARAVQWYHANPEQRLAMGKAGRARIRDQWNYETRFEPVRKMLERD